MTNHQPPEWTRTEVQATTFEEVHLLVDDICWHDSVMYSITLVRLHSADAVVIDARLLYSWKEQRSCLARVTLEGCYRVEATMNWGLVCMSDGEMIYGAQAVDASPLIDACRAQWPDTTLGSLFDLGIDLASTGSSIRVVGRSMKIGPLAAPAGHTAPPPLMLGGDEPSDA